MTISEPNPDVRPTGEEPAEFLEPVGNEEREHEDDVEPSARPSQSPPARP